MCILPNSNYKYYSYFFTKSGNVIFVPSHVLYFLYIFAKLSAPKYLYREPLAIFFKLCMTEHSGGETSLVVSDHQKFLIDF